MALLDQVLGYLVNQSQSQPPSQTRSAPMAAPAEQAESSLSPVAKGVLLVLAAKAWQAYKAHRADSAAPVSSSAGHGFHGLGGLMAMLGGATALRSLMGRFEDSGLGEQAQSWVGHGANAPIGADQVETAVGGRTLEELASRFGVSIDQLKSELAAALPQGVDQLTPQGRLPSDSDLQKL